MKNSLRKYLKAYLKNRPLFLGVVRAKELELFNKEVELKGEILDFGCGDGFFSRLMSKPVNAAIVGLERDQRVVWQARENGVYKQVVVYGGRWIPFADNYFDTIISNCVLEHVENLDIVLGELNRILRPGGRFYCTVMSNKWEEYLFGVRLFGERYKKWLRQKQQHFNLLTAKRWRQAFNKARFRVIKNIGYLDKRTSRFVEMLHYISIGSLIAYKLTGRWVLFPRLYDLLPIAKGIARLIEKDVLVEQAAALFFVLQK